MEATTELIATPIIQWGFAGMCIVLLAILVWLIRNLLDFYSKATKSIDGNTSVIAATKEQLERQDQSINEFEKEFLRRPCIAKGRAEDAQKGCS